LQDDSEREIKTVCDNVAKLLDLGASPHNVDVFFERNGKNCHHCHFQSLLSDMMVEVIKKAGKEFAEKLYQLIPLWNLLIIRGAKSALELGVNILASTNYATAQNMIDLFTPQMNALLLLTSQYDPKSTLSNLPTELIKLIASQLHSLSTIDKANMRLNLQKKSCH
jgi:hypothetical protein